MAKSDGKHLRLILPKISLRAFIECFYGATPRAEKTRKACQKAAVELLGGLSPDTSQEDLEKALAERLLEGYKVREALKLLLEEGLPLNAFTLSYALGKLGVSASKTTCATLIKWLVGLGVIEEVKGSVLFPLLPTDGERVYVVRVPALTRGDPERIYLEVLWRGEVRYKELRHRLLRDVEDAIAELISEGRIGLRYKGEKLERVVIKNPYIVEGIPEIPQVFKKEWRSMEDAKIHERLWVPEDAVIYPILR